MRLHFGPIPENMKFHPKERGWRPIPHDSPKHTQALALPTAVILFCVLKALEELLDFGSWGRKHSDLLIFLLLLPSSIVVHELLHAALHPRQGRSRRTILGFWPRHAFFFAHYEGRMSRSRFLILLLLPVSVLTVPPLVTCAILGYRPEWVAMITALNGAFGAGDVVGALRVLKYIPSNAIVRNRGWYTWWRADAETMARVPVPSPEVKRVGLGRLVAFAKWGGAGALFLVAISLVFGPFFGGHSRARNDLRAPTRVFEPNHGYQPVGAITAGDTVRLWRGAPDWRDSRPELSRGIWRAGYRFQMWKHDMAIVLVDERPETIWGPRDTDEIPWEDVEAVEEAADDEEYDGEESGDGSL